MRTLKEKAIDAANDSNTDEDRRIIQKEFDTLVDQIDDDALVQFNGMKLIDNSCNNAMYATPTILINQNLEKGIHTNKAFYTMKNLSGESIGVEKNDKIIYSFVVNGETMSDELTGEGTIGHMMTGILIKYRKFLFSLQSSEVPNTSYGKNKFGEDVIADRVIGMTSNRQSYTANQIAGFTITVLDTQGNIKQDATHAINFTEINRAENYSGDKALSFHVGADANQATKVALTDMRTVALGLKGNTGNIISISTKADANAAISALDNVIQRVLDEQSNIGAALSRLDYTATNLTTSFTNDQASESVIRDADMAKEMSGYLRYNVLSQASQAMLAQANQNSMDVISLLYT